MLNLWDITSNLRLFTIVNLKRDSVLYVICIFVMDAYISTKYLCVAPMVRLGVPTNSEAK